MTENVRFHCLSAVSPVAVSPPSHRVWPSSHWLNGSRFLAALTENLPLMKRFMSVWVSACYTAVCLSVCLSTFLSFCIPVVLTLLWKFVPYSSIVVILILLSQTNELIIRASFDQCAVPLAPNPCTHTNTCIVPVCVGNGEGVSALHRPTVLHTLNVTQPPACRLRETCWACWNHS